MPDTAPRCLWCKAVAGYVLDAEDDDTRVVLSACKRHVGHACAELLFTQDWPAVVVRREPGRFLPRELPEPDVQIVYQR